ncbi:FAD-dependent oxidoreductase [Candidatus Bathyarchaeota archaeon]|nr:FAD-dependent oxidoreductase [Candidatus Bathyarchaeota archaeon]
MSKTTSTDVLVIGGGLSGCMAAINAANHGAKVTILEKSHIERSGAAGTGNDHFWHWNPDIHPKLGWTIADMVRDISFDGEYGKTKGGYIDQELCEIVAAGTMEAVNNLESWGVQFKYDEIFPWNLQYEVPKGEKKYRIVPQFQSEWDTLNYDGRDLKKRLTEQCVKRRVKIFNRMAATGLLTKDRQIVGATGVDMRTGEFHVFKAKVVIMATGMDQSRLFTAPSGNWFNAQSPPTITGDGEAMAIRAGAEVFILQAGKTTNAGFQYMKNLVRSSGAATTCYPAGRYVNSEGETMIKHPAVREPLRKKRENVETSIREGKTPFYLDFTDAKEEEIAYAEWSYGNEGLCWVILEIMKDLGLDFRKDAFELALEPTGRLTDGFLALWINTECSSNVPGLFACSPVQFAGEVAAPTAAVLGWRSGEKAAKYSKEMEEHELDEKQIEAEKIRTTSPLKNTDGFTWQEVNLELNNIMEKYKRYVAGFNPSGIKDEISVTGIKTCLEQLEKLVASKMKAKDPHELVRCNEVINLIDVAKLMIRAAIEPEQYENSIWFLGKIVDNKPIFRKIPIKIKYPSKEAA